MKIYSLLFLLLALSVFISGCRENKSAANENKNEITTGGNCEYQSYSGFLTIKEVFHDDKKYGKTGYLVKYEFEADTLSAPEPLKLWENTTDTLTKEQISKANIKPGTKFRVNANYIKNGVCPPGPFLEVFENWE